MPGLMAAERVGIGDRGPGEKVVGWRRLGGIGLRRLRLNIYWAGVHRRRSRLGIRCGGTCPRCRRPDISWRKVGSERGTLGSHDSRVYPGHSDFLARLYRHIGGSADETCFAFEDGDTRRLIRRSRGFDIVGTGLEQLERAAGDLDLDALSLAEIAQLQMDTPSANACLDQLIIQVQHVEQCIARHLDSVRADPDSGTSQWPRLQ